jgi:ABC-type multidrug transport system permease subunit
MHILISLFPFPQTADAMASPSLGLFMVTGSYFVSKSSMPVWMQWITYVSPFSWATKALANIEVSLHHLFLPS